MAAGTLSRDERGRRKTLVEGLLRAGFAPPGVAGGQGSALEEACRRDGVATSTYAKWVRKELWFNDNLLESYVPDWDLYNPAQKSQPRVVLDEKPRVRIKAGVDRPKRILAIGDTHVQPNSDLSRFTWIGRLIGEGAYDHVVQIGDWGSWDSCSTHDKNDTLKGRQKPSFLDDLEAVEESLDLIAQEVPLAEMPPHHITFGNHEARVLKFENATPEMENALWSRVTGLFHNHGWQTYDYGEYAHIEGCSFVHVPLNVMNLPMGGKNVERTIANDAACSIIFGHTHRRNEITVPKIGIHNFNVTVLNLGSAMPHGYVAQYARLATTGWSYGVYEIDVHGGRVLGTKFISMLELARRFA
jgi:hypothetical protein